MIGNSESNHLGAQSTLKLFRVLPFPAEGEVGALDADANLLERNALSVATVAANGATVVRFA